MNNMIEQCKRLSIISEIVKRKPDIGKTAIMKYIFLLQRVYKVPLEYNYEIYTYGPYSSEVMEDIDYARHENVVSMTTVQYPSGYYGYNLNSTEKTDEYIYRESQFVSLYSESIKKIIDMFGDKSVKELELSTTIIYIFNTYIENNWSYSINTISENVHEIKPHFDKKTIEKEYKHLKELGLLKIS